MFGYYAAHAIFELYNVHSVPNPVYFDVIMNLDTKKKLNALVYNILSILNDIQKSINQHIVNKLNS